MKKIDKNFDPFLWCNLREVDFFVSHVVFYLTMEWPPRVLRLKGVVEKGKESIRAEEIIFFAYEMLENIDESFVDVIQLYFASRNGPHMDICSEWDLQVGLTT